MNPEPQAPKEPEIVIKNYYKSIVENKDVSKFVMMLSSAVSALKGDVVEALQRYVDYAFLWEKDKQEAVKVNYVHIFVSCNGQKHMNTEELKHIYYS